jgi:hypothetical protein
LTFVFGTGVDCARGGVPALEDAPSMPEGGVAAEHKSQKLVKKTRDQL